VLESTIPRPEALCAVNDLTPVAGSALLERMLDISPPIEPLGRVVDRLARFAASASMLERAAMWLGSDGDGLRVLARAEAAHPLLAHVDVEMADDAVAVVRTRGNRQLGQFVGPLGAVDVISMWLSDSIVVAHNGDDFDFRVLGGAGVEVPSSRFDTLRWSWLAWVDAPSHSLADCCERAGVPVGLRHDALVDAQLARLLVDPLLGQLHRLGPDQRGAIRTALRQSVDANVLDWALGLEQARWSAPELIVGDAPLAARSNDRELHEVAAIDEVLSGLGAQWTVAFPALRDSRALSCAISGWRVRGSRVIDRAALSRDLASAGWVGALGVRLLHACDGLVDLAPPSAASVVEAMPRLNREVVHLGVGPYVSDRITLAEQPPDGPVVLVDPIVHCFEPLSEADGDVSAFDPIAHQWPVRGAGVGVLWDSGGARTVSQLWARVLGGEPRIRGHQRELSVRVCHVTGVPARSGRVRLSRVAGLAAARSEHRATLLVTGAEQRDFLVRHCKGFWQERTNTGLARPPGWPTYGETRRRLSDGDVRLGVVTVSGLRGLRPDTELDLVFDRLGAPSPDQPIVARLLKEEHADSDPYGSVIEPITALRLLRCLVGLGGEAFLADPAAASPLIRSVASRAAGWRSESLPTLEETETAYALRQRVLESAAADSLATAPADPRRCLDDALARLLPSGNVQGFQRAVIDSVLDGSHTLAVYRTGKGKSLCYQASALALSAAGAGMSVVISPLIALQRDQLMSLRSHGILNATAINSELDPVERAGRLRGIEAGFYTLVFVAPEGLGSRSLQRAVQRSESGGVAMLVVDEAHCISEMGHDFRPSYRRLPRGLRRLTGVADDTPLALVPDTVRVLALTGTARTAVRSDIVEQLGVGTMRTHVDDTFVRPELRFRVQRVPAPTTSPDALGLDPGRWKLLQDELAAVGRPAIIYAATRRETELLRDALSASNPRVGAYHAGLRPLARRTIERQFRDGDVDVIVATNAFGMGVDKDDVKAVIHWRMPGTPEALYQEAGRAGRGLRGQPADCVVLYNPTDLDKAAFIKTRSTPTRDELERTWATLDVLRTLQNDERDTVVVTDDDVRRLAGLRGVVDPEVVLAHLEDAGLLREFDSGSDWMLLRRIGEPVEGLDPVEQAVYDLATSNDAFAPMSIRDACDLATSRGHPVNPASVPAAVVSLVRRSLIAQSEPVIRARPCHTDPRGRVAETWERIGKLARLLPSEGEQRAQWCRPRVSDVGVSQHELFGVIEAMASLGWIEVDAPVVDGRLPKIRWAPRGPQAGGGLARLRSATPAILENALGEAEGVLLGDLATRSNSSPADARDVLMVANLCGAIVHDPASWQGSVRVRLLALGSRETAAPKLDHARTVVLGRERDDRLRRAALDRYAAIEISEADVDPYQEYLNGYFTDPSFLDELDAALRDDVLGPLTDEQRCAVTNEAQRLAIHAGPGTGKTRVLTHRIAYRVLQSKVSPHEVIAVTFTKVAAGEMAARLAQLGVSGVRVSTINALAYQLVRSYWPELGFTAEPTVLDDRTTRSLVAQVLPVDSLAAGVVPASVAERIQLAKVMLIEPDSYPGPMPPARKQAPDEVVRVAYAKYEERKRAAGWIDFADQIAFGTAALRRGGGSRFLNTIADVYIDEAQDLTPLDWRFVGRLARRARRTAVGDPRQAINEWRGADPTAFEEFCARSDARLDLLVNHRSTEQILAPANRLMAQYPAVSANGRQGPDVSVARYDNEQDHDDQIARHVMDLLRHGVSDDDIAVITKTNESVGRLARVLATRRLPVRAVELRPLGTTVAFRLAFATMSEAMLDECGEFSTAIKALLESEEQRRHHTNESPLTETDYDDAHRLVDAYLHKTFSGNADLKAALRSIAADDQRGSPGGITVMTMARSKGLEWDSVIIGEADSKNLFATRPDDETRRVFYVAITRAKRNLHIAWWPRDGASISQFVHESGL